MGCTADSSTSFSVVSSSVAYSSLMTMAVAPPFALLLLRGGGVILRKKGGEARKKGTIVLSIFSPFLWISLIKLGPAVGQVSGLVLLG